MSTIAIIGTINGGKSSFINELVGCPKLLPKSGKVTTHKTTFIRLGEPRCEIHHVDGRREECSLD